MTRMISRVPRCASCQSISFSRSATMLLMCAALQQAQRRISKPTLSEMNDPTECPINTKRIGAADRCPSMNATLCSICSSSENSV